MIKNGFISLDENSERQGAAKRIALKKLLSSPDLSDSGRGGEDLIALEVMFFCVKNCGLTPSNILYFS